MRLMIATRECGPFSRSWLSCRSGHAGDTQVPADVAVCGGITDLDNLDGRMKSVDHKGEGEIIWDIFDLTVWPAPLGDDIANVPAGLDGASIQRRILPLAPGQFDIAEGERGLLAQELERHCDWPASRANNHHPGHRIDAFWQVAAVKKRPSARIVACVRVPSVVPQRGVLGDQDLTLRMALLEERKGFKTRRHQFQGLTGHLPDDRLTQKLLPPAFCLPVVHDQVGVPELAVVPNSRVRSASRSSTTIAALHKGQQVTATGTPPTTSLVISCQIRMRSG